MKKRHLPKDYAKIHGQSIHLDGQKDFCHNDAQRELYIEACRLIKEAKQNKKQNKKLCLSGTRSPAPRTRRPDNTLGTP